MIGRRRCTSVTVELAVWDVRLSRNVPRLRCAQFVGMDARSDPVWPDTGPPIEMGLHDRVDLDRGRPLLRGRTAGRVAQRESTPFTREGSQVQSLSRPPAVSIDLYVNVPASACGLVSTGSRAGMPKRRHGFSSDIMVGLVVIYARDIVGGCLSAAGRQARSRSNGVSPRRHYFSRREMSAAV